MIKLATAVVLALVLTSALPATPVLATGHGVVEGQVQNATPDGASPAELTVVLHIVSEGDRVERRQATTDSDGRYRFEGLDTGTGTRYLPLVEYQGAAYFPRPISLAEPASGARQSADITVYEATSSDQWIAHERANLLVQNVAPGRIELLEMGSLANVGERTYIGPDAPAGGERQTLRFSVPAGASDLAPQAGFGPNDISATPGGFAISSPVWPGRHQFAYSYSLPVSTERLQIGKRLEYPTVAFNLYVPDVGLRVDSPQLRPRGQTELGGQKLLLYSAENLPRGTELRLQLSGLPSAPGSAAAGLAWPILGLGSAALLGGLGLAYRRRRWPHLQGPASNVQRRGGREAAEGSHV
jgi:hypothetical protein